MEDVTASNSCGRDGERVFCRGWRLGADGNRSAVLAVLPAAEHPTRASLDRLAHEYALKDELDSAWAARPLELERERGRTMLVLEDPGGEPLERQLGAAMEVGSFLRLAIGIATALRKKVKTEAASFQVLVGHAADGLQRVNHVLAEARESLPARDVIVLAARRARARALQRLGC
jgi:hypothetical protein